MNNLKQELQEDLFRSILQIGADEETTLLYVEHFLKTAKADNYPQFYIDMLEDFFNDWEDWAYREWDWSNNFKTQWDFAIEAQVKRFESN